MSDVSISKPWKVRVSGGVFEGLWSTENAICSIERSQCSSVAKITMINLLYPSREILPKERSGAEKAGGESAALRDQQVGLHRIMGTREVDGREARDSGSGEPIVTAVSSDQTQIQIHPATKSC